MKLVLDMNIPYGWVAFLNANNHEAIHWRDIGDIRAEDTEIMEWARDHQHIVFTHDLDFGSMLYATNASAPSVIQLRIKDIFPEIAGNIVIQTLNVVQEALEKGSLVIIDPKRHRLRLLPLRGNSN